MQIECPQCLKVFNTPDTYIGKKVKCLKCNHSFIISSPINKQQGIEENTVKDQAPTNLKTTTISDAILRLAFRFAKGISCIIVALCFITLIGCIIALFVVKPKKVPIPQQLSLPAFSEVKQQLEKQTTQETTQTDLEDNQQSVSPSKSIEEQFGKQLDDLCPKYELNRQVLIYWLSSFQNQTQILFLSGLRTFLADSQEYKRQNQSAFTYADFAYSYNEAFVKVELRHKAEIESVLVRNNLEISRIDAIRKIILISLASSIVFLLAFLILPLLIQIEINTRALLKEKQH